jgi:cephalosporin hydroxylase
LKAKQYTLEEIEQFIIDAGSDSLAVFGGAYEGSVHIQQVPDELAPCILAILNSGVVIESVLEIGVASGGTTFVVDHFFKPGSVVLIDDNAHPKHILRPNILKNVPRQEIIGNSRHQSVIEQAKGPIDLLVIDGDHSYEGVKADVDNYLPLLRKGGFLILHDSVLPDWGVPRMVKELKEGTDVLLIDEYVSQNGPKCGVALFRKVSE